MMKPFLGLALGCTGFLSVQTLLLAKPVPLPPVRPLGVATSAKTVSFVPPEIPTNPPPGGRARGGAKRGTCSLVKPELTALVPFTEQASSVVNVWGLTTEAHPTLLFYVPYSQNSAYPTEFVLQDQELNPIYQKAIALPNRPGVVSISLPNNAPQLEVNKQYRWFFTIYCDPEKQSPPIYVEGVIKRVNLNKAITQQLEKASPRQQSGIYAQNGIWHEALRTLVQLRQQNPQDVALETEWKNLLSSIRLDDIATEPILSEKF